MSDKSVPPKTAEERHVETEKLRAETERSMEVAHMKTAHSIIEQIERTRAIPKVISIIGRIDAHLLSINALIPVLLKSYQDGIQFTSADYQVVKSTAEMYKSVRLDFQDVMGMKDDTINKLFPEVSTYFEDCGGALVVLYRAHFKTSREYSSPIDDEAS